MTEHIYLPNEIFKDLKPIGVSQQIAFAYSYYYYITYLYRYCKYIKDTGDKITQDQIKETLGYSPDNKKINFIIKKGGILDTIGYTETTTDYPIHYKYEENFIEFYTLNNYKKEIATTNDKNYKIKKPIKAFFRTHDSDYNDGTFYEVNDTHRIDYTTFQKCMNSDLQTMGFYIYGYIKHQTDIFNDYQKSYYKIADELSLTKKTAIKYIDELEKQGLISVKHMVYNQNLKEEEREANIYRIS